jgi:hypothetical protein
LEPNDQQAALQGFFAASRLELVMAGRFPTHLMLAGAKSATQQFARAALGHAKQDLLARLPGGLNNAEHPKITVSDEQALGPAIKNDLAGQNLLTEMAGAQGTI